MKQQSNSRYRAVLLIIYLPVSVGLQQPPKDRRQNDGTQGTARDAETVGQTTQLDEVRGNDVDSGREGESGPDADKDPVTQIQVGDWGGPVGGYHAQGCWGASHEGHRAVRVLDREDTRDGS